MQLLQITCCLENVLKWIEIGHLKKLKGTQFNMDGTVTNTSIASHSSLSIKARATERGQANTECCKLKFKIPAPTTIARRVIFLILFLSFLYQVINSGIKWHNAEVGTYQEKAEVDYLDYPSVSLCFLPPKKRFSENKTWAIANSSLELGLEKITSIKQRLYRNGRYPN